MCLNYFSGLSSLAVSASLCRARVRGSILAPLDFFFFFFFMLTCFFHLINYSYGHYSGPRSGMSYTCILKSVKSSEIQ